MTSEKYHPIQVVAYRTGLTQHAIRAWERRYRAVVPARTSTNRRLYSDDDILRLRLLQRAKRTGRSVGQIAHLPTDRLRELIEESTQTRAGAASQSAGGLLEEAVEAIRTMNGEQLDDVLAEAALTFSQALVIEEVVAPLVREIGERWRTGELRVAHEHLASGAIRGFLTRIRSSVRPAEQAPCIVVATPAGQWHELGALMAATMAAIDGWRVIYLGANLPAEDIAAAAQAVDARIVAVSIVYPLDDPQLATELQRLRRLLRNDVSVIAGGRGADAYRSALHEVGAMVFGEFAGYRKSLAKASASTSPSP